PAHEPVELRQVSTGAAVGDGALVDAQELSFQLRIARVEVSRAEVLRVVAPVSVGADPDLEERRLVLLNRAVARGGESLDPGPRPDERVAAGVLDLAAEAGAVRMHRSLPLSRDLGLGHADAEVRPHLLERERSEVVRKADPLDLLRRLDRAGLGEQSARVVAVLE